VRRWTADRVHRRLKALISAPILARAQKAEPHLVKPTNSLLSGIGTTVFTVMSALAVEHGSINLGRVSPTRKAPPMWCRRRPTH
jgi:hypothetical protein